MIDRVAAATDFGRRAAGIVAFAPLVACSGHDAAPPVTPPPDRVIERSPTSANDPRAYEAEAGGRRFAVRSTNGADGGASSCTLERSDPSVPQDPPVTLARLDTACRGVLADDRQVYVFGPTGARAFSFDGAPGFVAPLADADWPAVTTAAGLVVRAADGLVTVDRSTGATRTILALPPSTRALVLASDERCLLALLQEQPAEGAARSRLSVLGGATPEVVLGEVRDTPALNPAIRISADRVAFRVDAGWTEAPRPTCD
jgi:hypothetical protein